MQDKTTSASPPLLNNNFILVLVGTKQSKMPIHTPLKYKQMCTLS